MVVQAAHLEHVRWAQADGRRDAGHGQAQRDGRVAEAQAVQVAGDGGGAQQRLDTGRAVGGPGAVLAGGRAAQQARGEHDVAQAAGAHHAAQPQRQSQHQHQHQHQIRIAPTVPTASSERIFTRPSETGGKHRLLVNLDRLDFPKMFIGDNEMAFGMRVVSDRFGLDLPHVRVFDPLEMKGLYDKLLIGHQAAYRRKTAASWLNLLAWLIPFNKSGHWSLVMLINPGGWRKLIKVQAERDGARGGFSTSSGASATAASATTGRGNGGKGRRGGHDVDHDDESERAAEPNAALRKMDEINGGAPFVAHLDSAGGMHPVKIVKEAVSLILDFFVHLADAGAGELSVDDLLYIRPATTQQRTDSNDCASMTLFNLTSVLYALFRRNSTGLQLNTKLFEELGASLSSTSARPCISVLADGRTAHTQQQGGQEVQGTRGWLRDQAATLPLSQPLEQSFTVISDVAFLHGLPLAHLRRLNGLTRAAHTTAQARAQAAEREYNNLRGVSRRVAAQGTPEQVNAAGDCLDEAERFEQNILVARQVVSRAIQAHDVHGADCEQATEREPMRPADPGQAEMKKKRKTHHQAEQQQEQVGVAQQARGEHDVAQKAMLLDTYLTQPGSCSPLLASAVQKPMTTSSQAAAEG